MDTVYKLPFKSLGFSKTFYLFIEHFYSARMHDIDQNDSKIHL